MNLIMKLAVIGLGFMGLTHLKALQNIPGAELAAVASDDPVALGGDLTSVGGNLGVEGERFDFSSVNQYPDWREAVADPAVEAVDLCLPTFLHAPAAIAALEAGKHVLVEKPMALDDREAGRMLGAAKQAGRVLMVAQVLRFFPEYLPLIGLQRSGELGPMRSAAFRRRCAAPTWGNWLPDKSKSGGGVTDLLVHDFDMALHLFGPPEAAFATGYEEPAKGIDSLDASLLYGDGSAVTISGGWHHPKSYPFLMEYTVSFDGGTVEYSSAGRPPKLHRADGEEVTLPLAEENAYQAEIAYFLDCAERGARPERCPPEESAAAVKLARLTAEARSGERSVFRCEL